jgi:hypothetical protein
MAQGLGFIEFSTGDVLSAAAANGYLASQTVMVFADAAARTAAITTPYEGMMSYLKDTNATEYYSGSAWVALGGSASPLTTKGDLYGYSTTNARVAVGTNGQVLTADSTAATGVAWASPNGGMTSLASGSMSGSQVSITGLSGSYKTLVCYVISPTNSNAENLCVRLNNDTGTNYAYTGLSSARTVTLQNQSASSIINDFPVNVASGATQGWQITIQNYTAGNYKTVSITGAGINTGTKHASNVTGMWASTSAVTEIDLFPLAGNWSGGTYQVFGVK